MVEKGGRKALFKEGKRFVVDSISIIKVVIFFLAVCCLCLMAVFELIIHLSSTNSGLKHVRKYPEATNKAGLEDISLPRAP